MLPGDDRQQAEAGGEGIGPAVVGQAQGAVERDDEALAEVDAIALDEHVEHLAASRPARRHGARATC